MELNQVIANNSNKPITTTTKTTTHWQNWSGLQQSHPQTFAQPTTSAALSQLIQKSPKCRIVGAGHSFSPLVCTDDTLISLDSLSGLVRHDSAANQCTLHAGTRLKDLEPMLAPINQALQNQGDIDEQSIAGAVSTGTHGTGINLTCISAFVEGFKLITADGDVLDCDRTTNAEVFHAGRVALGSFGALSEITLQNMPRYRLKEQISLRPLTDILHNMDQWKTEHRHIECMAFVYAEDAIVKSLDPTTDDIRTLPKPWPSDDALLTLFSEIAQKTPQLNPYVQKLLGVFIKPTTRVDASSTIFPSPRTTRFNEMEYQVPAELGLQCLAEVIATLRKHKAPVFFPLEYRYVKGDDIWLSPFYQRDSASISVHQYHKQDCRAIFKLVEPIFQRYQGRPHWGKMHTLTAQQLQALYPRWDEFVTLRQQLDPGKKWLNPYLETLLLV